MTKGTKPMLRDCLKNRRTFGIVAALAGAVAAEALYGCAGQYLDEATGSTAEALTDSTTTTTTTVNYNKIVYLHGRSMGGWPSNGLVQASSAWDHVTLSYDGSSRLADSTARATVKGALATNCRAPNQCVIVCYSAGCGRMLLALDDLAAAGTPADHVTWITATASAAGGSEVADGATKWYALIIEKIFGGHAAIDFDLKVNAMRSTYGYIQNRAPVSMYHLAGSKDMCRKMFFGLVKLCGNKYFPNGVGDGAVPPHSSCGFASRGAYANCSATLGTKYTNRLSQQDALFAGVDHGGMIAQGVNAASTRIGSTSTYSVPNFVDDDSTNPDVDLTFDDGDAHAATGSTAQVTASIIASIDTNVVAADHCNGSTCSNLSQAALTGY
jgi:hypothetical protein